MATSLWLEGFWKSIKYTTGTGIPVGDGVSHLVFKDGVFRQISTTEIDRGQFTAPFKTIGDANRGTIETELAGGGPTPWKYKVVFDYELKEDRLVLRWRSPLGNGPVHRYTRVLERGIGPIPTGKVASGRPAMDDPVLGKLVFDDNFDAYESSIPMGTKTVEFAARGKTDDELSLALDRGRKIVAELPSYSAIATKRAEECWERILGDEPAGRGRPSRMRTASRRGISLGSITVDARGVAHFLFESKGMKMDGHAILVVLAADDRCGDGQLVG